MSASPRNPQKGRTAPRQFERRAAPHHHAHRGPGLRQNRHALWRNFGAQRQGIDRRRPIGQNMQHPQFDQRGQHLALHEALHQVEQRRTLRPAQCPAAPEPARKTPETGARPPAG